MFTVRAADREPSEPGARTERTAASWGDTSASASTHFHSVHAHRPGPLRVSSALNDGALQKQEESPAEMRSGE